MIPAMKDRAATPQYVVHKADNVIRVPAELPDTALASVELAMCVATVFRMLKEMNVLENRRFGVCGLGPAGLVAVQMAMAEGAESVLGFDLNPSRRELAGQIGATACYDPRTTSAGKTETSNLRLESAVDCVGAQSSVAFLMDHTDDVVALFGVQRENYLYKPDHSHLRLCGYKGHFRESAEYAVNLIREGRLNLSPMITHKMPLERYSEGIDLLETQKAVKVCFLPWES